MKGNYSEVFSISLSYNGRVWEWNLQILEAEVEKTVLLWLDGGEPLDCAFLF